MRSGSLIVRTPKSKLDFGMMGKMLISEFLKIPLVEGLIASPESFANLGPNGTESSEYLQLFKQ